MRITPRTKSCLLCWFFSNHSTLFTNPNQSIFFIIRRKISAPVFCCRWWTWGRTPVDRVTLVSTSVSRTSKLLAKPRLTAPLLSSFHPWPQVSKSLSLSFRMRHYSWRSVKSVARQTASRGANTFAEGSKANVQSWIVEIWVSPAPGIR